MAYLRDIPALLFRIVVVRVRQEQDAMRPVQTTDEGGYFACFEVDRCELIQAAHAGIEGALRQVFGVNFENPVVVCIRHVKGSPLVSRENRIIQALDGSPAGVQ